MPFERGPSTVESAAGSGPRTKDSGQRTSDSELPTPDRNEPEFHFEPKRSLCSVLGHPGIGILGHAIGQSNKKCMKYVYCYVLAFMFLHRSCFLLFRGVTLGEKRKKVLIRDQLILKPIQNKI